MEHIPQKDKKGKRLSICFLIVACIGLIGAGLLDLEYRWFYQLIAVMTYVISFEILNRYYLATYCYRLDGNDFMIRKTTGKRVQTLCNLELSTMIGIEKQPKPRVKKRLWQSVTERLRFIIIIVNRWRRRILTSFFLNSTVRSRRLPLNRTSRWFAV